MSLEWYQEIAVCECTDALNIQVLNFVMLVNIATVLQENYKMHQCYRCKQLTKKTANLLHLYVQQIEEYLISFLILFILRKRAV